jgi:hypothetical protein
MLMLPGAGPKTVGPLSLGVPPSPISLDDLWKSTMPLKDHDGQLAGVFGPSGEPTSFERLTVRIDLFQGDPLRGGSLLRSLTETVSGGNRVIFLLPGYGYLAPGERIEKTELLSTHVKPYLQRANAVAIEPKERPRQFIISCFQINGGGQGQLEQLKTEALTVSALGCNTVSAEDWKGALLPDVLSGVLDKAGITRRSWATGLPLGGLGGHLPEPNELFSMEFYLKHHPADLNDWAQALAKEFYDTYHPGSRLVNFAVADERGWHYPQIVDALKGDASYLQEFWDWLQQQGLTPGYFRAPLSSWALVMRLWMSSAEAATAPPASAPSLAKRRRFYWTMKFFTASASQGIAASATRADPGLRICI